MKILVVNGSPRGENGNTEIIVKAFLEGAKEAGAESETIYLKDKKINPCTGCYACWTKTPGVCIHKDDMPELLAKVPQCDVLVYATPLYIYSVSGIMKNFMDRLLPMAQPFIDVDENGLCTHPPRYPGAKTRSVVLISNSGFPQQAHFSGLKETMNCWIRGGGREMAGMICCAGGVLLENPEMRDGFTWYLDAARQAGREVVQTGSISQATQDALDRPLVDDQAAFCLGANAHWSSLGIERIGEPHAQQAPAAASSGVPLEPPTALKTMRDLVAGLALAFDPKEAGNLRAVVQFDVSDEDPGNYFVEIADGKCTAYAGEHPSPTITVSTPAEVWLGIARGKVNGATAFMTGKYKVKGDLALLMRFQKLFPTG